jgi:hypothetical protein
MARLIQEPQKDIDLLGFGFLTKLTGEKAKAKAFLDSREYRKHEVRELAMCFATGRMRCKAASPPLPPASSALATRTQWIGLGRGM